MTFGFGAYKSDWSLPKLKTLDQRFSRACITTKHYTPEIHLASFVLPPWIEDDINSNSQKDREIA